MKNKLIEENMNLVYFTINKYYPSLIYDEDIKQAGMVGLCKAACSYDESASKFSTYAILGIRNEIKAELRSRKKHNSVLSLDWVVSDDEGGQTTFGDLQTGEEDVSFVDTNGFYQSLTDIEQETYNLYLKGASTEEISKIQHCSKNTVYKRLRDIRTKWRTQV